MKLHLKFVLWWLVKHFIVAGFLLVSYFLIGAFTEFQVFDSGFLLAMFNLVMVLVPSNWATTGKLFPLSMGASRRQFFLMGQVLKLICLAIVVLTMCWLTPYSLGAIMGSMFLTICSGELLGALSSRWGKKGLILFTVLCAVFGGVVGAGYSVGVNLSTVADPLMALPLLPVGGVVLGCAETAVSWLLYRKMEIVQ